MVVKKWEWWRKLSVGGGRLGEWVTNETRGSTTEMRWRNRDGEEGGMSRGQWVYWKTHTHTFIYVYTQTHKHTHRKQQNPSRSTHNRHLWHGCTPTHMHVYFEAWLEIRHCVQFIHAYLLYNQTYISRFFFFFFFKSNISRCISSEE